MTLTSEQAIKAGFLLKCAEEGLSREETHLRIKQAIVDIKTGKYTEKDAQLGTAALAAGGTIAGGALGILKSLIGIAPSLGSTALTVGLGAPVLGGAAAGYGAAKLTGSDKRDMLDDAKQHEIVSEYERLTDEAKRRTLLKRIQAQTGKKIVPLSPSLGG